MNGNLSARRIGLLLYMSCGECFNANSSRCLITHFVEALRQRLESTRMTEAQLLVISKDVIATKATFAGFMYM